MARLFSIPTILRMVPNELLRQWFIAHVPGEFDPNWDQLGEREIDPMLDYLTDLPASQSNHIEIELQSLHSLACDAGMSAIDEMAAARGVDDMMSRIPADLNLYGRSMWVRLHAPEVFLASTVLREIDNLPFWRKRNDLPAVKASFASDATERLGRAISSLLKSQGRGQQCTVETLCRDDFEYFFVYADDFVRCEQTHDDNGVLSPQPIRPTMQIVFAYDRREGSLETFARLTKAMKEELERLFAECVLGWELAPYDPDQSYELDHLKEASFRLATDPADQVRVRIEEMKIFNRMTGRPHTIGIDKHDPDDTIHRALAEELNLERIPLCQAEVRSVAIRFEFAANSHRRAGYQTIRVLAPHSCNLRHASPDRVEIFQKYLKLWDIDCAPTAEPNLVAVGA